MTGNRDKTECSRGHAYDAANTRIIKHANGAPSRRCRQCESMLARDGGATPRRAANAARPEYERFMAMHEKGNGCWLWMGRRHINGYGMFGGGVGRTQSAHRLAWKIHRGPIPAGAWVLHTCDVKACVNPDHLYIGTRKDNVRDAVVRGRLRHNPRRLNEVAVGVIRMFVDRGWASRSQIAAAYGVSFVAVSDIAARRTWRGVAESSRALEATR